jgi:hypothetical protein
MMRENVEFPTTPPVSSLVMKQLELRPSTATIRLSKSRSFIAIGRGSGGKEYDATPGTTFTFQQSDGGLSNYCPGGTCRPREPGKYIITGTFLQSADPSRLTATATLLVLPPLRDNGLLSFVRGNVTLVASAVGALVFAFRCFAVTGDDPHTAFLLLSQTSIGDAIRAVLFSALPAWLSISCFLLAYASGRAVAFRRYLLAAGLWLASDLALAFVFFVDQAFNAAEFLEFHALGIPVLPASIGFGVAFLWQQRDFPRIVTQILSAVGVALLLLLFATQLKDAVKPIIGGELFWLPREQIKFSWNKKPFTGYVLGSNEDYLVIMQDKPRLIFEAKKDDLENRDFCYPQDDKDRSPKCP